jgi:hypothetical protein
MDIWGKIKKYSKSIDLYHSTSMKGGFSKNIYVYIFLQFFKKCLYLGFHNVLGFHL